MNHEFELKIQAWLDGEMSDQEAARIADLVANDPKAGALALELGTIRTAMAGNELLAPLPETREFHWSKIARQIESETSVAPGREGVSWAARWRKFVLPLGGVAALACTFALVLQQMRQPTFDEISATNQGMDAITFHDQSAGMTVVWLQDNSQSTDAAQPAKKAALDDANSDIETD
jgi:anti-sigma factor RsiW